MSNTGGGHRASAEALKTGFEQRYPNRFQVDIIDLLIDYLPSPLNRLPRLYPFLSNRAQFLWKLLWQTGSRPQQVRTFVEMLARSSARPISQVIAHYAPDLLVSVHPLVHEFTLYALEELGWQRPLVTVVTDLATVHPLWFHPAVERCFVASTTAYQLGLAAGLKSAQLRLSGLPVRPAFTQALPSKTILRQQLGLHPTLPAALLVGGGEGIGSVAEQAYTLAQMLGEQTPPRGQLTVICGRNHRLYTQLQEQTWPVPTLICGFVDNMPEWMAASDCIITKAGPGSIAEALISGLPIVLSGFIPGQEEGNVPFVVNNQVGLYRAQPDEIAAVVQGWFGSKAEERRRFAQNARRLARPQATFEIVESTAELLEKANKTTTN
jgi:1,2-diacylglycerol 3-beta-galactosyltransferase